MLSTFSPPVYAGSCAPKLVALRAEMAQEGLDMLLVPHADEYQNEWLAAYAERLAWLTHYTGSFGSAASGVLNHDTGVEATTDEVFQIGSVTKVFTTALVMKLVELGRVDLKMPRCSCSPVKRCQIFGVRAI